MEFVEEQRKRPTLSNSGEGVRLETYRFPLASTDGEEKKKTPVGRRVAEQWVAIQLFMRNRCDVNAKIITSRHRTHTAIQSRLVTCI